MSYSAVLLPTLHKLLQGLGQLLGCWACASWAAGCLLGARGDNDDGDGYDDGDTGGGGHGDDDADDEDGDAGCLRGAGGAAGNSLGVSSASKQSGNQCIWSNHLGFFFVSSFILILDFFVNILKLAGLC